MGTLQKQYLLIPKKKDRRHPKVSTFVVMLLFSILFMKYTNCATMGTVQITSDPSKVSEVAEMRLLITPVEPIPANGKIKITIPSTTSITQGSLACVMVEPSGTTVTCTATNREIVAVVGSSLSVILLQLNIPGFTNPPTTSPTDSFIVYTTDASDNILDQKTSGASLTATVGALTASSITPASDVVGEITTANFQITLAHEVPAGGTIRVNFPKWNPNAASGSIFSMIQGTYICTSLQNLDSGLICDFSNDILTLSKINPSAAIAAASVVRFSVTSVRNPLSTAAKSGISITTIAPNGGSIDSASLTLQVSTAAAISSVTPSSTTTTEVYESTNFRLTFPIPLDMDANWKFEITFPSDITISSFTEINGYQLFGGKVNFLPSATIHTSNNTVVVINAMSSYTTTSLSAIVEFVTIQNPLSIKTTGSFAVYLKTSSGANIASITTGITYTATVGSITDMTATPDATTVGVSTSVLFRFKPKHNIPASSKLIVTLPSETSIVAKTSATCTLSDLAHIQSSATCTVTGRVIEISSPFSADFNQDTTKIIAFKIGDITMPSTTAPSSIGTFETCYLTGGTCYSIDKSTQSALLTSTVGALTSFNVAPTSTLAYASTSYTFTLVPANEIPIGGKILITLPSEVTIPNPTYSGNSCSFRRMLNGKRDIASTGLGSSFTCTCTSSTILVEEGFTTSAFSGGGTISFDIKGIRNPVSTEPTSSFAAKTRTSANYDIDEINSGRFVIMTTVSALQSVTLSSSSLVNGAQNNLRMTVNSPSDLLNGYKLVVTFPTQVELPTTVTCQGVDLPSTTNDLATTVTCSKSGNSVTVTLQFTTDARLSAGNSFAVLFQNIKNPTSTSPSDNLVTAINNANNFQVNDYSSDLKIITTQPAAITTSSLVQSSGDASAVIDITISIRLVHDIPANGLISIIHPSEVSVDSGTLTASLLSPTSIASLTLSYTSSDRRIKITNMFPSGGTAGTTYQFQLKNVKNTDTSTATSSFTVTTYLTSSGNYRIDEVSTGLTMAASCNYPCATCASSTPSVCTSCLTATPALYLQDNSCVTVCDEGKLPVGNTCSDCNSQCVACDSSDANHCTKCGKTGFEYLSGTTCTGTCPDGTFGNSVNNNCDACDSTNAFCKTCSGNSQTCTSCLKTPAVYILYGTSCVSTCPPNESIYNAISDKCDACNSNCLTCSGSITQCTSCVSNRKLDLRTNTCETSCETGKTIESGSNCIGCHSSCNTCEIASTTCTSCTGTNVVTTSNACASSCSNSNEVAINGVCYTCDSSCSSCSGTVSTCTGCNSPFVLHESKCITDCPTKYQNNTGTCVEVGLVCPTNFTLSEDETSCVPTRVTCDEGFKLNSSGNCVPDGTGFVPFPFVFILCCLTLIVIAGKIKDKNHTRVIANLIALYGLVEPALMLTLFISCIFIGKMIPSILAIVALILHYCLNLTMLIRYKTSMMNDKEFSRWILVYRKTKITILILGTAGSFRAFKIFYAGLFGLDSCMARFENPKRAFMRPQNYLAFFSLAIIYVLLTVASVTVFVTVGWGYQALITAIEVIILYIILIILHILEKTYDPSPCSDKEYVQIGMKKYGEDLTMSGVPIHNYNDELNEKEEQLNIDLRRQALTDIVRTVKSYSKDGFFSDGTLKQCEIQTKMRRAFSFKELPPIKEEDSEDTSDEEKDYYYQPRRKRRFSIGTENKLEKYADHKFFTAIEDIRSGKYLPDNVYADQHPDRIMNEADRYLHVDRETQTDDNDLKLLWRLARTIPPFKLSDILGEFEMDPTGMYIIIRDEGKLKDKHGRLVNSRGYLIDEEGNVIHQNGTKIFDKTELDSNDEIPAPFLIDEDEINAISKPELIPMPKTKPKKSANHPDNRTFKRKDASASHRKSTGRSKRKPPTQERVSSIMTDFPKPDRAKIDSKAKKMRPITSNTKRPMTHGQTNRRSKPMFGNYTEGRTNKVKEETSDMNSTINLDKINISKRQNYMLNDTDDIDHESDLRDTKENPSDMFFKDYLLNQRPDYYGDTSDKLSKSRKLYY
ncbi:unnamed protein product [Moneuplotes crassus]|uniref:Uncharacterized protein n=1 Tax=Euplotes crassus TaxID=5936 RepID=A0AAD1XZC4_EUPCR|nr:unnamed protein product [Moneuplotes crassus]